MSETLFCPSCDRRLTPDHRCLSRRVFLGALFGALAGSKAVQAQAAKTGLVIDHIDWDTKTITFCGIKYEVNPLVPRNEIWIGNKVSALYEGMEIEFFQPQTRIVNLKEPG